MKFNVEIKQKLGIEGYSRTSKGEAVTLLVTCYPLRALWRGCLGLGPLMSSTLHMTQFQFKGGGLVQSVT